MLAGICPSPVWAGDTEGPSLVVLGVAQDGGFPHAGCARSCCKEAWRDPRLRRFVSSLALLDPASGRRWIFDATPDFKWQLAELDRLQPPAEPPGISGVFLTHGHIGHYTGLMHLGREVMGASDVPVYAMPRMSRFLRDNGPWSQLVRLENIRLQAEEEGRPLQLRDGLTVTPFAVPHRDEYTETVGYRIDGPTKSAVFIPDIDKWEKWERKIEDVIRGVDQAFVDGTFFDGAELPGRDMSEVPHPFITESMKRLGSLPAEERAKVCFIHLNHTNPALDPESEAARAVIEAGFCLARQGMKLRL